MILVRPLPTRDKLKNKRKKKKSRIKSHKNQLGSQPETKAKSLTTILTTFWIKLLKLTKEVLVVEVSRSFLPKSMTQNNKTQLAGT